MKPSAVFSNLIARSENSNGQLNISLCAPSAVNVHSDESNRAIQNLNSRFAARETAREKTPADFLRQIIIEQPIGSSTAKPEPLEMKLDKPPQKLTAADYNRAAWRAVFKKAGYGMLTDGEIQQAVGAMRDNKLKAEFAGFNIDNLRRYDAQPGPMFLDADNGTIESAKRAGQAVLQYQEYKAKGIDAATESGKNYVNGALGGFVEKPYNAVANNINGLSEPFRAGEKTLFGTGYIPELPRSTIGDKSAYWQQNRYGVSLNQIGEGATTLQVGIMTGKPLLNSRLGTLLGVQVGAYNVGVGASGTDPLNPNREMSGLERGSRIVGGTMGIASAPFSPGGRAFANDALVLPNKARNAVNNLDDVFKPPTNPPLAPAGNVLNKFTFGNRRVSNSGEPIVPSNSGGKTIVEPQKGGNIFEVRGDSRINIRRGDGKAGSGIKYAWRRHGGRGNPVNKSQFTISQQEVEALLQRKDIIKSPAVKDAQSGNYFRQVDVGKIIGHTPLQKGGHQTSVITIITDEAGNLMNVFPGNKNFGANLPQ